MINGPGWQPSGRRPCLLPAQGPGVGQVRTEEREHSEDSRAAALQLVSPHSPLSHHGDAVQENTGVALLSLSVCMAPGQDGGVWAGGVGRAVLEPSEGPGAEALSHSPVAAQLLLCARHLRAPLRDGPKPLLGHGGLGTWLPIWEEALGRSTERSRALLTPSIRGRVRKGHVFSFIF